MHPRIHSQSQAFTLLEIMVVTGIMAIVVAIAVPTWIRQREGARASACQEQLSKIDQAVEMYAMDFKLPNGAPVTFPTDLLNPGGVPTGNGFLKKIPVCPAGGSYSTSLVGVVPTCSYGYTNPLQPHILP